jgi:ribonuclease R
MTYTDVTAISEGDKEALSRYPDLKEFVDTAVALTKILQKTRDDRGSIAMDIKEAHILYRDGEILIPDHKRTISHEMIEQFMVLANESVASLMTEKGFPFVYRVHERPAEEKAQAFHDFLVEIGVHAKFDPDDVSPADYQQLLKELDGSPAKSVANRVMLRSMMKAKYSPENVGHFGLASACYCHFTSPIRRYPDLVVHRIVKQSLIDPKGLQRQFGTYVGQAAAQSSSCEKNAAEAERDVDSLYCVAYMQDRIGEEYDATVSGVTSRGVYAELDNAIEGFIDIAVLPSDSYDYIEEKFLLKGIKNTFRLGDRIRVQTVGVDWGLRRTQFLYLRHIPTPRV